MAEILLNALRLQSGARGCDTCGGGCLRFLADQVGQAGDAAQPANPVLQVVPEAQTQLAAGLFQTGKRVPTAAARVVARSAAAGVNQTSARNQVVSDTLKIVSTSLLGLTIGCAQCHNHKYDPIPQTDYYRIRAVFEPAYDVKNWRLPAARRVSLYSDADRQRAAQIEAEAARIDRERQQKQQQHIEATFVKQLAKVPEPMREKARAAHSTPTEKRTAEQQRLLKEYPSLNVTAGSLYLYDSKAAAELKALADKAAAVRAKKPVEDFVRALTEVPGQVPATRVFHRGDPEQPRQQVRTKHRALWPSWPVRPSGFVPRPQNRAIRPDRRWQPSARHCSVVIASCTSIKNQNQKSEIRGRNSNP